MSQVFGGLRRADRGAASRWRRYTAIGEQVGMAQPMESVAPPSVAPDGLSNRLRLLRGPGFGMARLFFLVFLRFGAVRFSLFLQLSFG